MIPYLRLLLSALLLSFGLRAAAAEAAAGPSAVQRQRADKIVASLGITDSAKAARIRDAIARQYYDLSLIHAKRDAALKAAKAQATTDKAAAASVEKAARDEATAAQDVLHSQYLVRLTADLTTTQVDQVKDGMTYGVLPLTFRVYQEMLPQLTAEQKAQILAWLTEAREHAMDASTSEEKHGWFGKYKGRINNYLSKAGIDMKQAEKHLAGSKHAEDPK